MDRRKVMPYNPPLPQIQKYHKIIIFEKGGVNVQ